MSERDVTSRVPVSERDMTSRVPVSEGSDV